MPWITTLGNHARGGTGWDACVSGTSGRAWEPVVQACHTRRAPGRLTQFHRSDEALSRGTASLGPALQLWGEQPTATRQPAPLTPAALRIT